MNKYFETIALIILILIANIFFASPILSIYNIAKIERAEVQEDTIQARKIIDAEVQRLNATAREYSGWDDAYAFTLEENPKFISSSLGEAFYSKRRLNVFCMIANDGRIVFSEAHDYHKNVELSFPSSLLSHLKPGSLLLKHDSPESSVSGYISLPEGLLMIVSRPILTTEYKGPPQGTLVIGRFLDQYETLQISKLLNYKIELLNSASNDKNPIFQDNLSRLSGRNDELIQTTQDDRVVGHAKLTDIYGQVAGLVSMEKSRTIFHKAKQTTWHMIILYVSLCSTGGIIYMLLRKKLVVVRRSEQVIKNQLHSFIELAVDGILSIGDNGRILMANSKVCEITGYTSIELLSMRFSKLFTVGASGELTIDELLKKRGHECIEKNLVRIDARIVAVELTSKRMPDGTLQCFMRDVSTRKAMEQEMIQNHIRMNDMAIEVSIAEERERGRIAGELHDQVGPNLLLGKMKIDQLQAGLPDSENVEAFESAKEFINKAIQDIRSLTFQLRPPILANAGLEAALRWLAQEFGQQHGILVNVQHVEAPIQLEYGVRVTLYQAVRELLLNVVKHAKARHVLITVNRDPGMLILTVGDDGVGFSMPKDFAMHSNSFGLFNTHQRIKYHGGQMHIDSSPGRGTRVFITIPLETGVST